MSCPREGDEEGDGESRRLRRLRSRLHSDLPPVEAAVTFAVAIYWWAWFVFRWVDLSNEYFSTVRPYLRRSDVRLWLPFFSRPLHLQHRDSLTRNWEVASQYLLDMAPWLLLHHIVERTVRKLAPKMVVFIIRACHPSGLHSTFCVLSILLLPPWLCFLVSTVRPRLAVLCAWITGAAALLGDNVLLHHGIVTQRMLRRHFEDEATFIYVEQVFIWGLMRTVGFCSEIAESEKGDQGTAHVSWAKCLGFYCYLPSSYMGPLATFDAYLEGLEAPPPPLTVSSYARSLLKIFRLSLTLVAHNFLVHFVFLGVLSHATAALAQMNLASLAAVGIFRIMEFSAMYVPTYGISQEIAKMDGYKPVPYPTCLAHVYHYSECWRLFDVGFYNYVRRYIYRPIIAVLGGGFMLGQLPAMVAVYTFVMVYHGASDAMLRWTAFNFCQVLVESMLFRIASKSEAYARVMSSFSGAWKRRIHAVMAVPSWFVGGATLQYFFSGSVTVGDTFLRRTFVSSSWSELAATWAVGYTGVQLAIEANNILIKRDIPRSQELKNKL